MMFLDLTSEPFLNVNLHALQDKNIIIIIIYSL